MEGGPAEHANTTQGSNPTRAGSRPYLNEDISWLHLLGQISPVGIYRTDPHGRCVYVNERWCELTGLTMETALGTGWEAALHPEDAPLIAAEWRRACLAGEHFRMEYRYLQPDGRVLWVFGQAIEERNPDGTIAGYVGTSTDVTDLRRMREELQNSHAELEVRVLKRTAELGHLARIVEASGDAIISSALVGTIVSWNSAAERVFGYSAAEMVGKTTFAITPADRLEEAELLKQRVRQGERIDNLETVRVARSGELIEISLSLFPLRDPDGRVIGTSAILRDIRGQKKAERRLHQLSGRLLRIQDEERRRLARELHDSTAQSLAALAVNLSLLNHHAATLSEEKRTALLADGLDLAETIGRELRTHAYLLHPPLLDERGLPAALRWLAEGFSTRSGIAVDLDLSPHLSRLPEQVELTVFRVVQESLCNIHRHANSPTARITLGQKGNVALLEIRDAGTGLPKAPEDCIGVGIAGMRERVAQVGGTLKLETSPAGTTVAALIPLT